MVTFQDESYVILTICLGLASLGALWTLTLVQERRQRGRTLLELTPCRTEFQIRIALGMTIWLFLAAIVDLCVGPLFAILMLGPFILLGELGFGHNEAIAFTERGIAHKGALILWSQVRDWKWREHDPCRVAIFPMKTGQLSPATLELVVAVPLIQVVDGILQQQCPQPLANTNTLNDG